MAKINGDMLRVLIYIDIDEAKSLRLTYDINNEQKIIDESLMV